MKAESGCLCLAILLHFVICATSSSQTLPSWFFIFLLTHPPSPINNTHCSVVPCHRQFTQVCCMILNLLNALSFPSAFSQNEVVIAADPTIPASLGKPLTLTCTVILSGLTEISWTETRVDGTGNELSTDISTGVSTLTILVVLSVDLGEYMCTAMAGTAVFSDVIIVTAICK